MNDSVRQKQLYCSISRRKLLAGMGAVVATTVAGCLRVNRSGAPNREVLSIDAGGKLTCDNSQVIVSPQTSRVSTVADFNNRPTCELLPDSFDGPFYVCTNPESPNIAVGKEGVPLLIALRAIDASTCKPIGNAVLDIWHCDALGVYSGYGANALPIAPHVEPTTDARQCRGALRTDADGIAEFSSIYPGWYRGRAVHIHIKAHLGNVRYLSNQFLLPEIVNARVFQQAPYSTVSAARVANAAESSIREMEVIDRGGLLVAIMNVAFQ